MWMRWKWGMNVSSMSSSMLVGFMLTLLSKRAFARTENIGINKYNSFNIRQLNSHFECLSVRDSVLVSCLISFSDCLSVYLFVCQSICLSAYLSVYLCLSVWHTHNSLNLPGFGPAAPKFFTSTAASVSSSSAMGSTFSLGMAESNSEKAEESPSPDAGWSGMKMARPESSALSRGWNELGKQHELTIKWMCIKTIETYITPTHECTACESYYNILRQMAIYLSKLPHVHHVSSLKM